MNEKFDLIVSILEILGTIAFAASGALVAIRRHFDLFGVIIIGVTTAVGGGILRDIVIGSHPIAAFRSPVSMCVSAFVSLGVFIFIYLSGGNDEKLIKVYDKTMLILDTVGLGIFTITGITAAMRKAGNDNVFLMAFSGVITGVGGGVLRDVLVNKKPEIFTKNIYAVASVAGAICFLVIFGRVSFMPSCIISFSVTCALRLLSVKFDWNLPGINMPTGKGNLKSKKGEGNYEKF